MRKYFLHSLMLLLMAFSAHTLATDVKGHNVVSVKYTKGEWVQKDDKIWLSWQFDRASKKANIYTETHRDEWSVYLQKGSTKVVLDLYKKKYTYEKKGKSPEVFDIVKASSTMSSGPVNAYSAAFIRYNNGRYVEKFLYQAPLPGVPVMPFQFWEEWSKKDKEPRTFMETGRDEWSIYLQDSDAKLRIDLYTKEVFYTQLKPKKSARKLYSVENAYRAIPSEKIDELTIESIETLLTAGSMDTAGRVGFELTKTAIEAMATGGYGAAARGTVMAETIARKFLLEIAKGTPEILLNAGYNEYKEGLYRDNCKVQKATTASSRLLNERLDNLSGDNGALNQWKALAALPGDWFEMKVSEVDDLLVTVDGKALWSEPKEMKRRSIVHPSKKFLFRRSEGAVIQLMEKDAGAGNDDDLGAIRVTTWTDITHGEGDDCVEKYGNIYYVLAPEAEDGSFYKVVVSIKENVGSFEDLVDQLVCGTKTCIAVPKGGVSDINMDRLDRDKDKSDLKKCPSGYYKTDYVKYPQMWPAADVYLRKCNIIPPV